MKRSALAAIVAAGTWLVAGQAKAEDIILKVAHFFPPTSMANTKVMEPWCKEIEKASAGRMKCQIYPAMQLGGTPPQLVEQAIDGIADIVWTLPGYTAGRFPSVEAFELPFMTNKAEAASRALWRYYEKYGRDDFKDLKPLAFNVHDEGYIHDNKRPIKRLADFRGLKMRAPTRMTNKFLAYLGATPVAMPLPAVPEAVSKGVVDGYVLPWEIVPTLKLHEMTKYHTETDANSPALYTAVFMIAMNKASYAKLPDDMKKIIDAHSGLDLSASIGRAWDESAVTGRQQAVDQGSAQFDVVTGSELAAWRKIGDKLSAKWVEDMNDKGFDGHAMLDSAKALIAEENAK